MLSLRCRINANVAELLVIIVYTGRDPRLYLPRHRPPLSSLSLSFTAASFHPIGVTIDRDLIYGPWYRPTEAILVWLDWNIHGRGSSRRSFPLHPYHALSFPFFLKKKEKEKREPSVRIYNDSNDDVYCLQFNDKLPSDNRYTVFKYKYEIWIFYRHVFYVFYANLRILDKCIEIYSLVLYS